LEDAKVNKKRQTSPLISYTTFTWAKLKSKIRLEGVYIDEFKG